MTHIPTCTHSGDNISYLGTPVVLPFLPGKFPQSLGSWGCETGLGNARSVLGGHVCRYVGQWGYFSGLGDGL